MSKEIGKKLRTLRIDAGYTLEFVGQHIGVARPTIFRYENGEISGIPSDKIEKLAKLYNVSPGYLMGWEAKEMGRGKLEKVVDISDRPCLTTQEIALLAEFHRLNDEGKGKVFSYMADLAEMPKYTSRERKEKTSSA